MAIPPYFEDTEKVQALFFASCANLKDEINRMAVANMKISHLSMGMSHDYEVAVEEGATHGAHRHGAVRQAQAMSRGREARPARRQS